MRACVRRYGGSEGLDDRVGWGWAWEGSLLPERRQSRGRDLALVCGTSGGSGGWGGTARSELEI